MQQLPRSKPSSIVVHPSFYSAPVSLIPPTLQTDREKKREKKERKVSERKREREKRRESSHDSRRESTSGARSCLRVAGSMSQWSRLVSSRSPSPSSSLSRILLLRFLLLLLLVVVLILAKCCDRHPLFVCSTSPPPRVDPTSLSFVFQRE